MAITVVDDIVNVLIHSQLAVYGNTEHCEFVGDCNITSGNRHMSRQSCFLQATMCAEIGDDGLVRIEQQSVVPEPTLQGLGALTKAVESSR